MKIIISPAKKMKINNDFIEYKQLPIYLEKAEELVNILKNKNIKELQKIFCANIKITEENYKRYQNFSFNENLTPAILAYDGIQYTYMAPNVFSYDEFRYVEDHVYILSGLYGILNALDGIRPYRLEMLSKLETRYGNTLYEFWSDFIYKALFSSGDVVLNLCSFEYRKNIEKYLKKTDKYITVNFYDFHKDKYIEKAVYAKMARGSMVRYLAENQIEDIEDVKKFTGLGYQYNEEMSDEKTITFVRKNP